MLVLPREDAIAGYNYFGVRSGPQSGPQWTGARRRRSASFAYYKTRRGKPRPHELAGSGAASTARGARAEVVVRVSDDTRRLVFMVSRGAAANAAEIGIIADYLARTYPLQ